MATIARIDVVDGKLQDSVPRAAPPRSARIQLHGTLLVALLLGMSLAFGVALLRDSPLLALGILLVLLIGAGIMSVAWMRPPGASPEHHPKIDHYLDDTSP